MRSHYFSSQLVNKPFCFQDAELSLEDNKDIPLAKLKKVVLTGPFGSSLVAYLLYGADQIKSLTLGVQWYPPFYNTPRPLEESDVLGKEYLVSF